MVEQSGYILEKMGIREFAGREQMKGKDYQGSVQGGEGGSVCVKGAE